MPPSAYTLDFEKPLQELERQIEELERLGEDRQIDVSTELGCCRTSCMRCGKTSTAA